MITLYQRQDCPFCWRIRVLMVVLGLEYRSVDISLGEKHPDIVRLSPAGRSSVPLLVDERDDLVIWESAVIISYLQQKFDTQKLLAPSGSDDFARLSLMNSYADASLGPAIKDTIFEKRAKAEADWDKLLLNQSEQKWQACCQELEGYFQNGWVYEYPLQIAILGTRLGLGVKYGLTIPETCQSLSQWFAHISQSTWYKNSQPETCYWQGALVSF